MGIENIKGFPNSDITMLAKKHVCLTFECTPVCHLRMPLLSIKFVEKRTSIGSEVTIMSASYCALTYSLYNSCFRNKHHVIKFKVTILAKSAKIIFSYMLDRWWFGYAFKHL